MVEAGVQAGYPRTDDLNGYQQEGFGPMLLPGFGVVTLTGPSPPW
jgi:choline dehydrogenase-like flavoprotein